MKLAGSAASPICTAIGRPSSSRSTPTVGDRSTSAVRSAPIAPRSCSTAAVLPRSAITPAGCPRSPGAGVGIARPRTGIGLKTTSAGNAPVVAPAPEPTDVTIDSPDRTDVTGTSGRPQGLGCLFGVVETLVLTVVIFLGIQTFV